MTNLESRHASPFKFFIATQRKQIPFILINIVCYSLGTVAGIGISFYLGRIIDGLTGGQNISIYIVFLVLVLFGNEIFYRIGHIFEVLVDSGIRAKTKKVLFSYTSKLSFGYFSDRFAGQISHQIGTVASSLEEMKDLVTNKFIDNSWMILVSIVTLAFVYPPLAIVIAVWTLLFILGLRPVIKKINFHAEHFAQNESNTTGTLVDMYTNIATVKVYGKNLDEDRVYKKINAEYISKKMLGKWSVIAYAYQGISGTLLACVLIAVTAYGYMHGVVSIGNIILIVGIGMKILDNVYETGNSVSSFIGYYGECSQALKDILVVPSVCDGATSLDLQSQAAVAYNGITFSYDHGKEILKNFSLDIPACQKIGIVGLSGAGKTTMVNLLLRFFDPQQGTVTLNSTDITTMTQESLRSHISFISQDTSLFHMTIAENIQYGSPIVPREKIEEVAQMAYAHEFISALPKGYDTIVGERGVKLSGGQRQRVAIARAMLKNSPLFLLDEATSALDSDSEHKVQDALLHLMKGKTVIAIAHRLSTLQFMDRIVFIEDGKIIEDGTHSELLALAGKYATLWNMQVGGFLPPVEQI